jgi:flagellar motor switch protein FliN/FliY
MDPEPTTTETGVPAAAGAVAAPDATTAPLAEVPVVIAVDIGHKQMPLVEVAELGVGSIVVFDRMVGEPVDLVANGRKVAAGEIIEVDGRFALRVTEIRRTAQ